MQPDPLAPWPPLVGAVYRVPDRLTGWSQDRTKERWAMVVAVSAPVSVRVLPRSASSEEGIAVAQTALGCFTKDGCFYYDPKSITFADLKNLQYGGQLEPPFKNDVLNLYWDELARREAKRHARRGRRSRGT